MNTTQDTSTRWRDIENAKAELHGCATAISATASAFAAAFDPRLSMLDGDGAYEILISIHHRQARALAKLDALVIDGLRDARTEPPIPKPPPR